MATVRSITKVEPVGSQNTATSPANVVLPRPLGLAAKDALLVCEFHAQGNAGGSSTLVNPPNMIKLSADGATGARLAGVYVAIVDDPEVFAAGIPLRGSSTATRLPAVAIALTPDAGKHFELDDFFISAQEWNGSAALADTAPAVAGDTKLAFYHTNKSASTTLSTHTPVGGGTLIASALAPSAASGSVSDSVASVILGGTGVSFNISQANGGVYAIGFNEILDDTVDLIEIYIDDEPHELYVVDEANTPRGIERLGIMPRGYSIAEFEADMELGLHPRMGHRNIGATLPECTTRGTLWAMLRHGLRMPEFSAQRTADGVWVGMHDDDADRVTSATGLINSLNWSQLEGLTVEVGGTPTEPPATVSRLDEWLQCFPDYLLVVDNKTSAFRTEFMTMLLNLVPDAQNHVIIKVDGASPLAVFQDYFNAGFKTMAYWYNSSNWTNALAKMPYVNYPGLNYNAAQSYWDDMIAMANAQSAIDNVDRYFWGHVLTTEGQATTSLSKGADFLQCSASVLFPTYTW